MKINRLLQDLQNYSLENYTCDINIEKIVSNSQKCVKNSLFFAMEGSKQNGETFAKDAVKCGAVAICTEKKLDIPVLQIIVKSVRRAYAQISAGFYDNPQKKLKIIGVIGTNGKTSTTKIISHILNECGLPCATVGTLGYSFNDFFETPSLTTPDPEEFFCVLSKFLERGAKFVAVEYSAHAIFYEKLYPVFFEALIFTNCTEDHLDFFNSIEEYSKVKAIPFLENKAKYKIINTDDSLGLEIAKSGIKNVVTYGIDSPSYVFAIEIKESREGTKFIVNLFDKVFEVTTSLLGKFNVYNLLACIVLAKLLGIDGLKIISSVRKIPIISGRMEKVCEYRGASVFVDYAHTPDGLEKSLCFLRRICGNNLYCLFGCGGNRDRKKRSIMGRVAGDICDFVILTSDNPRYEDANKIIGEIECGLRESSLDYVCIEKREVATRYALARLQQGDILLIAGKGGETTQEIMGVKHYYSDKETVLKLIENV